MTPPALERAAQESIPSQASGAQQAGEVVGAIPDEVVEHQGATTDLPLKMSDTVYWQDLVKTLDNGRVRIRLMDSSLLNVGVRSEMRIVQHDPQSQQTQIELGFGRLRGEVKKLTKSGSKFEVVTPTALIGVVGTVFDFEVTKTATRVHVVRGRVWVHHRDPSVKGETVLRKGQQTDIAHAAPPTPPVRARQNPEIAKDVAALHKAQGMAMQAAAHNPQSPSARAKGRGLPQLPPRLPVRRPGANN